MHVMMCKFRICPIARESLTYVARRLLLFLSSCWYQALGTFSISRVFSRCAYIVVNVYPMAIVEEASHHHADTPVHHRDSFINFRV